MKKVLTLVSALSMVAGSAVAHDYNWNFNDSKLVLTLTKCVPIK